MHLSTKLCQNKLLETRQIHAFDLDGTLLFGNSGYLLGKFLFKKRKVSFSVLISLMINYIKHKNGLLSLEQLHEIASLHLRQSALTFPLLEKLTETFFCENKNILLFHKVYSRLLAAQKRGDVVAIVSSSPSFIVHVIARILDIKFFIGTHYAIDIQGYFTSVKKIITSNDKVRYIRQLMKYVNVTANNTVTYSDSYLDLPLLQSFGKAVCICPDEQLTESALRKGWEIIVE